MQETQEIQVQSLVGGYPGEGHGNPLQYSRQENPIDRELWWATAHRVGCKESDVTQVTEQAWHIVHGYVCGGARKHGVNTARFVAL